MPPVEMPVVLYGLQRSVYTRIARLALMEKVVAHSFEEVEIFGPEGVPPDHLARHPFGRIPALRHESFLLYETAAITRYIDEAFPGPALQPQQAQERARMNQVVGILDSYAYRPMIWGVFVQRVRVPQQGGQPDEEEISRSLATARTCLSVIARLLGHSTYLAGSSLSLADLHAYPMLRYFSLAPEGRAELERFPNLLNWVRAMLARPSVVATVSQYEPQEVARL
jgi:glutathione S-transferase